MSHILAIANQKGGVGKTTTAINLAARLAALGHRTLLIDIDPQGNATSSLGAEKAALPLTMYDALVDQRPLTDCLIAGIRPNLDLLPANSALVGAEVELVAAPRREYRLRDLLAPMAGAYAAVVIDCPPSLGLLTLNALAAADAIIIPIQCEYLALEGLMQLINTIDLVKRRLNSSLDILGVVMTMYDARTRLSAQVVQDVQRFFPSRMIRTVIPRAVRLAEAPSYGQTIYEYDPASRAAEAYRRASDEVRERIGLGAAQPETLGAPQ